MTRKPFSKDQGFYFMGINVCLFYEGNRELSLLTHYDPGRPNKSPDLKGRGSHEKNGKIAFGQ